MAFLMASLHLLAAICPGASGAPSQEPPDLSLVRALCAEPRVVGTAGYERGLALLEARLGSAGLAVERLECAAVRSVPRRSDVLLFEDSGARFPFGGLRERWDPDAPRPMGLPAAYPFNVESADVRGPVVDVGAGLPEDYARLAELRVDVAGAVALVTVPVDVDGHGIPLAPLAERAADAGCVGVLVGFDATWASLDSVFPLAQVVPPGAGADPRRLTLPCAPVRGAEARAIKDRLRARRVRGPEGDAVSVKVGPGPVEVQLTIECPEETLRGPFGLAARWPAAGGDGKVLRVAADEDVRSLLGGAVSVQWAVDALVSMPREQPSRPLHLVPGEVVDPGRTRPARWLFEAQGPWAGYAALPDALAELYPAQEEPDGVIMDLHLDDGNISSVSTLDRAPVWLGPDELASMDMAEWARESLPWTRFALTCVAPTEPGEGPSGGADAVR